MISSNFLKKKNHFARVAFVKAIIEIMIVSIKKKSKKMTKKIKKILMNDVNDDSNEKIILDDFNSENYQRVISVSSFKSDSESKTKNDR